VPPDGPRQLGEVFAHLAYLPRHDGGHHWTYTGGEATDTDRRTLDDGAVLGIVRAAMAAAARG
jgi:hypothetical protein